MSRPLNTDAALCETSSSKSLALTFMAGLHGLAPRIETMRQPLSRLRHPLPLRGGEG